MATIVTRASKGSALTWTEGDANITNLNNDKIELTDLSVSTNAASGGGTLSYNNATGGFAFSPADLSNAIALSDLSVGTPGSASGNGAISYNNTTGEFTYTPPDLSSYLTDYTVTQGDVTAHQAALSITESQISDLGNYLTSETVTSLSLATNTLSYTDEQGNTTDIDLSLYLDDTNLARLTSGTLNASTGIATFTRDDASTFTVDFSALLNVTLADLSVTSETASGNGSLTYNNSTGVFTFTPADLSSVSSDVVDDTTPQLGGDLDVNGKSIVDATNGTVDINGFKYGSNVSVDGSGDIVAVNSSDRLELDDTGNNLGLANGDALRFSGTSNITFNSGTPLNDGQIYYINFDFGTNYAFFTMYTAPVGDPSRVQVATGMATGSLSGVTYEIVEVVTPSIGAVVSYTGSALVPSSTVQGVELKDYKETVYSLSYASTLTPDVANGNVQKVTLTGNVTINGFANAEAGQSMTLILTQDGTGSRTLSTTMKMAGGDATLSTDANAIDILSIFYDGTNYYGSLGKAFATPA